MNLKRKTLKKVFQDFNAPDFTLRMDAGEFTFGLNRGDHGPPLLDIDAEEVSKPDGFGDSEAKQKFSMQLDPDEAREIGRVLMAYADAWQKPRKWYGDGVMHGSKEERERQERQSRKAV